MIVIPGVPKRTLIKQYGCFKLVHFLKKSGHLSSTGPKILAFGSHCSVNFQSILDCSIPIFIKVEV